MILLDTNVLSYAVGEAHPLREACRRLIAAHREGTVELGVTVEVLQEFAYVRARRRPREEATSLTRLFADALTVVETTVDDLDHGLELFQQHPEVGAFDAVLAAVAVHRNVQALVSADRGFARVAGLRCVDPGTPELSRLLPTPG